MSKIDLITILNKKISLNKPKENIESITSDIDSKLDVSSIYTSDMEVEESSYIEINNLIDSYLTSQVNLNIKPDLNKPLPPLPLDMKPLPPLPNLEALKAREQLIETIREDLSLDYSSEEEVMEILYKAIEEGAKIQEKEVFVEKFKLLNMTLEDLNNFITFL